GFHFSIKTGEVVGILAPSGAGKSTFAKILAGYLSPQKGTVRVEGQSGTGRRQAYNPVQLIFQHPEQAINPLHKMEKVLSEVGPINQEAMAALGIDPEWLDRWPTELSGGELQRFCVLRILNTKTRFIIADEMTTMLDAITQAQIWEVVLDYAKAHEMGVVVISHSSALVNRICQRVVTMGALK
ncbi:MAG TPA: nickel ABC transporter ATP-binding protein, partial [Clostridiales bacterium UBA8960]|nr:nickel ABC transporter ATP-binding protein [Clostridiales bacterium UBA8960]